MVTGNNINVPGNAAKAPLVAVLRKYLTKYFKELLTRDVCSSGNE